MLLAQTEETGVLRVAAHESPRVKRRVVIVDFEVIRSELTHIGLPSYLLKNRTRTVVLKSPIDNAVREPTKRIPHLRVPGMERDALLT